ncbi:hypothetical protein IWT140_00074 [Secundilactobacillus pentosiphilus]|uniref:Uncharacterized protein n=1 Tax=Secundilactobacillus pentosiphilus TaxID=1714682 RepID=A0A1Z5IL41_9LACO|nr:hypothetical protein [Secundilactobacillus pentosiphilus]GAX02477.1 hypothetical protein IWT140_00074 [Secundilactobacillus pentosiphilus]
MQTSKLVTVALIAAASVTLSATQASAKTTTKVRYYQNIKNRVVTVKNQKAAVYTSATLKHHHGTMKGYGKKVVAYYAAHVTQSNGHRAVYYKFRTSSHKIGWVWSGYLKNAKVASSYTVTTDKSKPQSKNTNGGDYVSPATSDDFVHPKDGFLTYVQPQASGPGTGFDKAEHFPKGYKVNW